MPAVDFAYDSHRLVMVSMLHCFICFCVFFIS